MFPRMKYILKLFVTLLFASNVQSGFSQLEPVDVAELTLKIGGAGSENLYYGFAKGDIIVFNFKEIKGKGLKEVEITELPKNSKFMDFKASEISDKRIVVNKEGIYQFSFKNSALSGRIVKVKIQRVPASEDLISFNTGWEWKTMFDTTYVGYKKDSLVGYDTTYVPYKKKELVRVDTTYESKKVVPRVHTRLNINGDLSTVKFTLPTNQVTLLKSKKVIAWAYYFGCDEKEPIVSRFASTAAKIAFKANPLAGLALGLVSFVTSTAGKNIQYYLVYGYENANAFMGRQLFYSIDNGDASMASNRYAEGAMQGTYYLCFDNNQVTPVDVLVKFTAVVVTKTYEFKTYEKVKTKPRYVTLDKKRMVVKDWRVRVNAQ